MSIVIENGVRAKGNNEYEYTYADVNGVHKVTFYSLLTPKLGDIIEEDGTLTKATLPIINDDTSKWREHFPEVWGRE